MEHPPFNPGALLAREQCTRALQIFNELEIRDTPQVGKLRAVLDGQGLARSRYARFKQVQGFVGSVPVSTVRPKAGTIEVTPSRRRRLIAVLRRVARTRGALPVRSRLVSSR